MKNKKFLHQYFILLCLVFFSTNIYGQREYYMIDYHVTKDMNITPKTIKILGNSAIDPKNSGKIDKQLFESKLKSLIPNKNSTDILCIDLENKIYQDLRNNKLNSKKVANSIDEFVSLIKMIRNLRPHVKVGVYALPFPVYYDSQLTRNQVGKFDKIFKEVDYIFPSIYIYYPAAQKGLQSNINYFNKNLDIAVYYAKKYNKEIIPFFWYLVHPSNKKFSNELLDINEMKYYIDYLWNYSENKYAFKGIVLWNSTTPFTKKNVKTSFLKNKKNLKNTTEAINYYQSIL